MEKVVRDGEVAVLVSWEYGSGWFTNNALTYGERLLFDPEIVEWVEQGKPAERIAFFKKKYPEAFFEGFNDLVVEWVRAGTRFIVTEYDGYESLTILDDVDWIEA